MSIYDVKIQFFKNIIDNIIIGITKYNNLNIISTNDYNNCFAGIEKVVNLINTINHDNYDNILVELQYINNSLSSLIKNYGILNFSNLIDICLDSNYTNTYLLNNDKYNLINKFLHPISYKILNLNNNLINKNNKVNEAIPKNKIIDDKVIQESPNLECYDLSRISNNFNIRIYGIKVIVHDYENKKTLIINTVVDNTMINNIDNNFILDKKRDLLKYVTENNLNNNEIFVNESWNNFFNELTIKDYLIYSNNELFNKYIHIMNSITSIENKTLETLVNEFVGSELFNQRNILITLLLNNHKPEFQYIAYLLYDLLSDEKLTNSDSNEQKLYIVS